MGECVRILDDRGVSVSIRPTQFANSVPRRPFAKYIVVPIDVPT